MRVSLRVTNWAMMSPIVNHQPVPKSRISRATRKESLMERGPKQQRKHRLVKNKTKSSKNSRGDIFRMNKSTTRKNKSIPWPITGWGTRSDNSFFPTEIIYDGNYRRANYFSLSSRWRVPKPEWQAAQLLMFLRSWKWKNFGKKNLFVSTFVDIAPLWDQRLSCRGFNQQSIIFLFVVSTLLSVSLIKDRRCFSRINCVINVPPAILQFLS